MSGLGYSANLSMLFADLPVLERPYAAAAAGYSHVESWWPFAETAPREGDIDDFCYALQDAGLPLVALNLHAGDHAAGQRGLLSLPDAGVRVNENLEAATIVLATTRCSVLNVLYGNRQDGLDPTEQDRIALTRLASIADQVAPLGVQVVVETLNTRDSPSFPLTDVAVSAHFVRRAVDASRHGNIGLLLDTYHLATMGTDPAAAIREYAPLVRHVQFADAPGRGRPGTGAINFGAVEKALLDIAYRGFVGLEYAPTAPQPEKSTANMEGTS